MKCILARQSGARHALFVGAALFCLLGFGPAAQSASISTHVAVVPSFLGAGGAGFLDPADFPAFAFHEVSPASVLSVTDLAGYDTVVLWQFCDVASYPAFTAALVAWVQAGGKLLIWDGDSCSGGAAAAYAWLGTLGAGFSLSTGGRNGIQDGALSIVQENKLSSANPASPYFIDTAALVDSCDAVGDANVMQAQSAAWCTDMQAENGRCDAGAGSTGPVHAYTKPGALTGSPGGWIVYSGLDYGAAGSKIVGAGRQALVRVLLFEFQHGWGPRGPETADLCGTPVPALSLSPLADENTVGETHTVAALFTQDGAPTPGVEVSFSVLSGPHAGVHGAATTGGDGKALFSYVGQFAGTDTLQASAQQPLTGVLVHSNKVSKVWDAPQFTLIGVNDVLQSSGIDQLIRFDDLTTGVASLVGPFGDHFVEDEAIAVESSTQRIFAVDNARLLLVNPLNGNGTLIGPVGFSDIDGIAFHPQTGVLYGVTHISNKLLTINTTTGAGTQVAGSFLIGHRIEDIAFHPDGRCFVLVEYPAVFQVNAATGAKIQRWNLTGASSMECLTWSPDGTTLYSAADRGTNKDLVTIHLVGLNSSTATFVSPTLHSNFVDIEGLAWLPSPIAQTMEWPMPVDTPTPRLEWRLTQNEPNPFNPSTSLRVSASGSGPVTLGIFDAAGRLVRVLYRGGLDPGTHRFDWDGRDGNGLQAVSGVYFCRLLAPGMQRTIHMVLAR